MGGDRVFALEGRGDEFMSNHFQDSSLVLPTHGHQPPEEADAPRSSALIDLKAISDHTNATT
uniref:Uncharacterized protein n=1 Tax=Leersia perrieri TaxID=77586 RepID=A0A0D9VQ64_9ORYZ